MTRYLHTMYRITDPETSRAFYKALGCRFSHDMDIVRDGELEATNYFFLQGVRLGCGGDISNDAPARVDGGKPEPMAAATSVDHGAGLRGALN